MTVRNCYLITFKEKFLYVVYIVYVNTTYVNDNFNLTINSDFRVVDFNYATKADDSYGRYGDKCSIKIGIGLDMQKDNLAPVEI
jgi:hypothetical protein